MTLDTILKAVSRTQRLGPVEQGKIKIGGLGKERPSRSGGTWRMPRKDDHFTVTTLSRNKAGDLQPDDTLMAELLKDYGETDDDGKVRLREIPVRVLSDDIEDILQANFAWYGRKACGARSDGKRVTWFYDPATFEQYDPPKVEEWEDRHLEMTDKNGNKMFKLHATFNCVIASKAARWGGVYKFRTTSVISFRQLYSSLVHIHQLTGGILMGMPLFLVVRPMHVNPMVKGKSTGATVYVCHLELRGPDIVKIQHDAAEQARFRLEYSSQIKATQARYRALLEQDDDPEYIQQEFHPEYRVIDETVMDNVDSHIAQAEEKETEVPSEAPEATETSEVPIPDYLQQISDAVIPDDLDVILKEAAKVLPESEMLGVLQAATEKRGELGE